MLKAFKQIQALDAWYTDFYWHITLAITVLHQVFLGVSVYMQRYNPAGVSRHILEWVNPEVFLVWSLSAVVAWYFTERYDPTCRLGFFHFSASAVYIATGCYLAITGQEFNISLFVNYMLILFIFGKNYLRTLFWTY